MNVLCGVTPPPAPWRPPLETWPVFDDITAWIVLVAGLGVLIFTLSYGLFSRFWQTIEGLALFLVMLCLSGVFLLAVLGTQTDNNYIAREWVRLAVFSGVAGAIIFLNAIYWRKRGKGEKFLGSENPRQKN